MSEEWTNWSGSVTCRPRSIERPGGRDAMQALMDECVQRDHTLRVVGAGHSFSPLVRTSDVLVSLENWSGVDSVQFSQRRVQVRAGTSLHDLGALLDHRGLGMENMGDIDRQSIAGAISTGTHGTGAGFGVLADQVTELELLTPDEGFVRCSPEVEPERFRAAQVSLGALGIVTGVTLRVEPQYNLKMVQEPLRLEACLESLGDHLEDNRHFEFFWFPGTDWTMAKTLNPTEETGTGRSPVRVFMENGLWGTVCLISALWPSLNPYLRRLSVGALGREEAVAPSHEIFPTRRSVRFNEMEYALPAEAGPRALREIKRWIEEQNEDVLFPVEVRFARGDDILLSPAYQRDTMFIAVHKYHSKSHEDYFRACEEIFLQHEGRPHWGKIHTLDARELRARYPAWGQFQAVRRSLDSRGIMLNDHLRTVFKEEQTVPA